VSDEPRALKKTGWHEHLEELLRTEIIDETVRKEALKALEYTVEAKNAIILGLLATLENRAGTEKAATNADPPR
jgi:hypothetical protein